MDFNDAEKRYRELKSRYSAGQLSNQDFEAEVNQLLVSDAQGREWMIGVKTGKWYYADGERWVEGTPPRAASSAPTPTKPPAAKGNQRLLVIGGIVAAVLILLLLAAGSIYLFLSSQSARIANAPTPLLPATPTLAGATTTGVRTPTLATVSTNAPTAQIVLESTPTQAPIPTNAVPATTTSGAPPASPTLAAKPGVYVTNMRVDPQPAKRGDNITFYVTFLNTTSQVRFTRWRVQIWNLDPTIRNPLGTTNGLQRGIQLGTNEMATDGNYRIGGINACTTFRARAVSEDEENNPVLFVKSDGSILWLNFGVCP